jgi:hypothetical protein
LCIRCAHYCTKIHYNRRANEQGVRVVAKCLNGKIKLSIRECCNKIIHAKDVSLTFVELDSGFGHYWNGVCALKGDMYGKPWHIELDIKKWVLAMKFYYAVIVEL